LHSSLSRAVFISYTTPLLLLFLCLFSLFFLTDPPTTEIYTLSLHDALPISYPDPAPASQFPWQSHHPHNIVHTSVFSPFACRLIDRKSTRLNSSHVSISYAVFCLKKKKKRTILIIDAIATRAP